MIAEVKVSHGLARRPEALDYGGIGTAGVMDTGMSAFYTIVQPKRRKFVRSHRPSPSPAPPSAGPAATGSSVRFRDTVEAVPFSASAPVVGLRSAWTAWTSSELLPDQSAAAGPLGLEHATVSGCGVLRGQAVVRNLAFQKLVVVRISLDQWDSFVDIPASYAHSRPSNSIDVFEFEFDLNAARTPQCGSLQILFALKCDMNGAELWDNNGGQNYSLTTQPSSCPSPCIEHLPLNDNERHTKAHPKPACVSIYSNYLLPSAMTNPHHPFNWSFS